MRYLIYLRVSTDEQDTETQLRMCKEKINQLEPTGDFTFEVFSDFGMSSGVAIKKRTELQRMLSAIRKSDTLIVYKLDRLSRDVIEMVTIYRQIVKTVGAKIISLSDAYQDEFSVSIMGAVAQKERDDIRLRTRDKLATKAKKGERYSRYIPYGYTMHETHMIPIKVNGKTVYKPGVLVPVEQEQQVVARMCQFFEMGMSYSQISQALVKLGYMNREGNPFQKMSIYRILARIGYTRSSDQLPEERAVP